MADGAEDRGDLEEKLKKVFISEERIADLASLLKLNIIQKLLPSLQKEDTRRTRTTARRDKMPMPPADPEGLGNLHRCLLRFRSRLSPIHTPRRSSGRPTPTSDSPRRLPTPGLRRRV